MAQEWITTEEAAQIVGVTPYLLNASRIVVFGALARNSGFTRWSDIDIAAWGLAPEDTFRTIGTIMDLQTDIAINLVDVNAARSSLIAAIERDGVPV